MYDEQAGMMTNLCSNYKILSEGMDDSSTRLSWVAKTIRSLQWFHCNKDRITIER